MPADWEVLRELFERALVRSPHERAALLHELTDGDAALRHEVESLIVAHEAASEFLIEPALGDLFARTPPETHALRSSTQARLAPNTTLGPFTVVELLGSGGMGEVYRALDARLDRFVAIKVLSPELDVAPRARDRFEREARALSRLSHPRICTVYDVAVSSVEGRQLPFLVMELVEGETLAERLRRGPLSLDESLTYAIEVADALLAAHEAGIVHRDLKPANVMVTSSGVKLLDFGLAQLRSTKASSESGAAASSASLENPGMAIGTLPYMSPEQLRARKVDARTDIYAVGSLLHEMVTGDRPFHADSQAGLIAAILEHDAPSIRDLQPLAPVSLDHIVRKCLEKNPENRWQTARDLKTELMWVRDALKEDTPSIAPRLRRLRPLVIVGIATAIGLFITGMVWRARVPLPAARTTTRLSLSFPPGVTLDIPTPSSTSFAVSADGRRVAYVGVRNGMKSLYVYSLDTGDTLEVPNTEGAGSPTFSPGGEWIAFSRRGRISKVTVGGGSAMLLCSDCGASLLTWLPDNRLLLAGLERRLEQVRIRDSPFAERPTDGVTVLEEGDEAHHRPALLPDGSVLFTVLRGGWHSPVNSVAISRRNEDGTPGSSHEVVPNATSAYLVGKDALVFARGASFFASRFDVARKQLVGDQMPLPLRVQHAVFSAAPMYAVSSSGTLVYAAPVEDRRLVWVDREGREESIETGGRFYTQPRLSPDGRRVAVYLPDGDRDIWIFGLNPPRLIDRLTRGPDRDSMAVWSPDGTRVFFSSDENKVCSIAADRAGAALTLFAGPRGQRIKPQAITPDGATLLVSLQQAPNQQIDLGTLSLGSSPRLTPLLAEAYDERDASLSPDGRWLVYQSEESDEPQIVVRPFPAVTTSRTVISAGFGQLPIWSRNGQEIFYRAKDGTLMAVPVNAGQTFQHSPPAAIINPPRTLRDVNTAPTYDVSADGRRFLFINAPELEIRSLTVVQNWDVEVNAMLSNAERVD